MGLEPLVKRIQDDLSCDQYFCTPDRTKYYLIEQKVRDDHDSTKKRGQIENFRKKLEYLKTLHGPSLSGIMYFIDPALHKNEGYYRKELEILQHSLEIPVTLFYDGELFQYLQGHTETWDLLLKSLQIWRKTAPEQISLDYDAYPERAVEEIVQIPGSVWHKLASTDVPWEYAVLQALFPTGRTLMLLANRFQEMAARNIRTDRRGITYDQLAEMLRARLQQFYSSQL
jgi:hypothetical protein